jgi:hypothetical protein
MLFWVRVLNCREDAMASESHSESIGNCRCWELEAKMLFGGGLAVLFGDRFVVDGGSGMWRR